MSTRACWCVARTCELDFTASSKKVNTELDEAEDSLVPAQKAADYLDMTSFSHSGLGQHLIYEGFTQVQTEYRVGTTGL